MRGTFASPYSVSLLCGLPMSPLRSTSTSSPNQLMQTKWTALYTTSIASLLMVVLQIARAIRNPYTNDPSLRHSLKKNGIKNLEAEINGHIRTEASFVLQRTKNRKREQRTMQAQLGRDHKYVVFEAFASTLLQTHRATRMVTNRSLRGSPCGFGLST